LTVFIFTAVPVVLFAFLTTLSALTLYNVQSRGTMISDHHQQQQQQQQQQ
jgi:hypothetical protein